MSALSDYAENKVLDVLGANATFTAPSNVYLGLSTASFNDDGSGTEISGNNYARVAVSFGSAASRSNWVRLWHGKPLGFV
jgi:hypothetical protein